MATTATVGQYSNPSFQRRNFFDPNYRQAILSIIEGFIRSHDIDIYLKLDMNRDVRNGWRNIGQEDDIHEMGVAFRITNYEIRYKLVAEDFSLYYYDTVNPKCITDLVDTAESIDDVLLELFKNLGEDKARVNAMDYMVHIQKHNKIPIYPDDPPSSQPGYTDEYVKRYKSKLCY